MSRSLRGLKGVDATWRPEVNLEEQLNLHIPSENEKYYRQVQLVPTDSQLSVGLRLIKFVVFLGANSLMHTQKDPLLSLTHDLTDNPDVVELFLQLVVNYSLYWLIPKLFEMKTPAINIFAGRALICAVDMENDRLIQDILRSKPPLDAKIERDSRRLTALNVAGLQQNYRTVKRLLEAGASPGERLEMDLEHLQHLIFSSAKSRRRIDPQIFQTYLDAHKRTDSSERYHRRLQGLADSAIDTHQIDLLKLILKNIAELEQDECVPEDKLMQLQIAVWEGDLDLAANLLNEDGQSETLFDYSTPCIGLDHGPFRFKWGTIPGFDSEAKSRFLLLRAAIEKRSIAMTKLLLEYGIDPFELGYSSAQILFRLTTRSGEIEILKSLLATGIDTNDLSLQLLHDAALCGRCDMISYLFDQGWDPHALPHPSPLSRYYAKHKMVKTILWPIEAVILFCDTDTAYHLLSNDSKMTPEECSKVLGAAILSTDFATFQHVVKACTRKNMVDTSTIIQSLGSMAFVGFMILLNRFGHEFLQWLFDEGLSLHYLSSYIEGDHTILTSSWRNLYTERYWLAVGEGSDSYALVTSGGHSALQRIEETIWGTRNCELSTITFDSSPTVLKSVLRSGIRASQGLMRLCILSCAPYSTENTRILMLAQNAPNLSPMLLNATASVELFLNHCKDCGPKSRCKSHHLQMLNYLVDQGATVKDVWLDHHLRNRDSTSDQIVWQTITMGNAWYSAISQGLNAFQRLIQLGANVNEKIESVPGEGNLPTTPLAIAASHGMSSIITLLLRAGADASAQDKSLDDLRTPLVEAAERGYFQISLELLRAGADINDMRYGDTALQCAASEGRVDVVCLLLENNNDLEKAVLDCSRAAHQAKMGGHSVIANLISAHSQKLKARLGVGEEEVLKRLCWCKQKQKGICDYCFMYGRWEIRR